MPRAKGDPAIRRQRRRDITQESRRGITQSITATAAGASAEAVNIVAPVAGDVVGYVVGKTGEGVERGIEHIKARLRSAPHKNVSLASFDALNPDIDDDDISIDEYKTTGDIYKVRTPLPRTINIGKILNETAHNVAEGVGGGYGGGEVSEIVKSGQESTVGKVVTNAMANMVGTGAALGVSFATGGVAPVAAAAAVAVTGFSTKKFTEYAVGERVANRIDKSVDTWRDKRNGLQYEKIVESDTIKDESDKTGRTFLLHFDSRDSSMDLASLQDDLDHLSMTSGLSDLGSKIWPATNSKEELGSMSASTVPMEITINTQPSKAGAKKY